MAAGTVPQTLKTPTKEELQYAFDVYTAAVGRVVSAWNNLHEILNRLFIRIVGGWEYDRPHGSIASAVWYSSYNDRAQRQMLEAAIRVSGGDPGWKRLPEKAAKDILDVLEILNGLGNKRDEAIHAPAIFLVDKEGVAIEASILSQHRRARALTGKELLIEFDWLERYINNMGRFISEVNFALSSANSPWPDRPLPPDRRPRKALRDRLRRLHTEQPTRQPRSSPR